MHSWPIKEKRLRNSEGGKIVNTVLSRTVVWRDSSVVVPNLKSSSNLTVTGCVQNEITINGLYEQLYLLPCNTTGKFDEITL